MNVLSRFALLAVFSVITMLPGSNLFAQREIKDRAAVIVGVEGVDDVLGNVSYLVGAAGFPEIVPLITFGAGEYVRGIDKSKPMGGYLTFEGEEPKFVLFIPVTDFEQVLDTLSEQDVEIEEDGNYRLLTIPNGSELTALEQDGWAFISDDRDNLENLPSDPEELVSDLTDKYTIGAHANVANIPDSLKDQAIEMMREGFNNFEDSIDAEDGAAKLQRKMNEMSMENTIALIKGSDTFTIGWAIDKEGKRTFFDFEMTGKEGSKIAKAIEAAGSVKPSYTGFRRDDAAINFHMATMMVEEDRLRYVEIINDARDEIIAEMEKNGQLSKSEQEVASHVANEFLDVLVETVKAGKFDMAGSLTFTDGIDLITAIGVEDGAKLAESVEEALTFAEKKIAEEGEADKVTIKRNVETHQGIKFHQMSIETPLDEIDEIDDEVARNIFGERMTLSIGLSPKAAYIGFGENSIDSIKKAVSRQAENVKGRSVDVEVSIARFVDFAKEVNTDDNAAPALQAISDSLAETGNDKILLWGTYEGNKATGTMEFQEGLIRLIGVGVKQFQQAMAGGRELEDF